MYLYINIKAWGNIHYRYHRGPRKPLNILKEITAFPGEASLPFQLKISIE